MSSPQQPGGPHICEGRAAHLTGQRHWIHMTELDLFLQNISIQITNLRSETPVTNREIGMRGGNRGSMPQSLLATPLLLFLTLKIICHSASLMVTCAEHLAQGLVLDCENTYSYFMFLPHFPVSIRQIPCSVAFILPARAHTLT